ncbi:MarR family transcriptional regulator [Pseudaminobacter sp. NGMCC 1.201702]|uniref:MarR family transcriptional regulator n=1 Tax=Pseudaminobacter sp. NGMCC 1.201702 TaxID=3391825 RepID=UPI0039F0D401
MGAVAEARGGLSVSGIARNMGLVRQSVQRIADDLAADGVLRFTPNPHHRRAKLVQLTTRSHTLRRGEPTLARHAARRCYRRASLPADLQRRAAPGASDPS